MVIEVSPITTKLPFGKSQLFSYSVPKQIQDQIQPGSIVEMPLGARVVKGVVFNAGLSLPPLIPPSGRGGEVNLKPIAKIIPNIQLTQTQLDLAMWMHRFYHAPLGIILKFFIPDIPKKTEKIILKNNTAETKKTQEIKNQKSKIKNHYDIKSFQFPVSSFLIGGQNIRFKKYIELIKKYRKQNKPAQSTTRTVAGRQILILVPQIIDVETLYSRMASLPHSGMGGEIGKLHSQLNMTEYYNNWAGFQNGDIDVLIGTRQAILSPPSNLGLIIIDEFSDDDFKQLDQTPRFSAVEAARKVCGLTGAELVFGGSMPEIGNSLPPLEEPPLGLPLPKGEKLSGRGGYIIDTQNEYYGKNFSPLSNKLQDLLIETEKNKKWSLVLVNRRGESSYIICKDCGNVIKCPKCDIPLVLHKCNVETRQCLVSTRETLICHRCSYKSSPLQKCPVCKGARLKFSSPGTQGIEKEIADLFSGKAINLIRIDGDILKTRKGMGDILKKLQKESGIIIATQISSKIWLPKELDLIGFLSADSFLNRPDFRASEKTFRIISELKSRLSENGKLIIQTFNPDNKVLKQAAAGDFEGFCQDELTVRKQFNNPPFSRIIKLTLMSRDVKKVLQEMDWMKKKITSEFKNIDILGPIPCEIAKRGLFGKSLVLKISDWSEEKHMSLMNEISDEWTVE